MSGGIATPDSGFTVLIVDDHPEQVDDLSRYLKWHGYAVSHVGRLDDLRDTNTMTPDLTILDAAAARAGAWEAYLQTRDRGPVILKGLSLKDQDRILALELGAHDVLTGPVNLRELVARIRAVLRRSQTVRGVRGARARFAGVEFDLLSRCLVRPGHRLIPLSVTEFHILKALLEEAGRPVTRARLHASHSPTEAEFGDRIVNVQISRLRQKLYRETGRDLITTRRGEGYAVYETIEWVL